MRLEIFLAVGVHISFILETLFLDAIDPAANPTTSRSIRTLVPHIADRVFDLGDCSGAVIVHPHDFRNFVDIDRQTALAAH